MMKFNGKSLISKLAQPTIFVLIGIVARVIPHAPNFVPIGAMALFGGAYLNKKQALTLPILAMIVSDFFLGFDSIPMRFAVYGSFILMVLMGMYLKNKVNIKNTVIFSLASSVLFFIITNFTVWAFSGIYPHTILGLSQSYFFAIPFFRNTIFGDLFYSGLFFGGYSLIINTVHRVAWQQNS